jgi:hypothetical protein
LEQASLLDGIGRGCEEYSQEAHFAQMIGLLGPPPKELLDRTDREAYSKFYTSKGINNVSSMSQYVRADNFGLCRGIQVPQG